MILSFITKGGSVLKMYLQAVGGFFSLLISLLLPTHLSADQITVERELTVGDFTAGQGIAGRA